MASYTSAIVYWFTDRVPKPCAIPYKNLRKWKKFDMEIAEENVCEGLWTEKIGGTWIPCIILRLESVRDAIALRKRCLTTPSDQILMGKEGQAATSKLMAQLKTTVQVLRAESSKLRPLAPKLPGRSSKKSINQSVNQGNTAINGTKTPVATRAATMFASNCTGQSRPPLPVNQGPTEFMAPISQTGNMTQSTSSAMVSEEVIPETLPPTVYNMTSAGPSQINFSAEFFENLQKEIAGMKEEIWDMKNKLISAEDKNAQLYAKYLEQQKRCEKLEEKLEKKRKCTEEEEKILSIMKAENRPAYAIKKGMLEVFDIDDLIYGVLSKKGLKSSPIARFVLDAGLLAKVEDAMGTWSAVKGKEPLTHKDFRKKVQTILETAKTDFKNEQYCVSEVLEEEDMEKNNFLDREYESHVLEEEN